MRKVPAFICGAPLPSHGSSSGLVLAEAWLRHQRNGMQQREAVLHQLRLKSLGFPFINQGKAQLLKAIQRRSLVSALFILPVGAFSFPILFETICLSASKSFWKGE